MLQALYLLISGRFTTSFTVGLVFAGIFVGIFVVIFAGMNYFLNTLISGALKEV